MKWRKKSNIVWFLCAKQQEIKKNSSKRMGYMRSRGQKKTSGGVCAL